MKKIKRSISILLIAMMALAMLGGCGNNSTSGNSTADGDSTKIEKTADAGEAKGTESNPFILGVSPMSGWYAWYGIIIEYIHIFLKTDRKNMYFISTPSELGDNIF